MKAGESVELTLNDKSVIKGILLASSNPALFTVKLPNGYNIYVDKKSVRNIKKLRSETRKIQKPEKSNLVKNSELPTVLLLHTGGTIASKVDYRTGGVTPLFSPEDILGMFPELSELVQLKSIQLFNVLSENLDFSHYNKIAQTIKEWADKVDGIIVTQGTDTLHYTPSAISFILKNLPIPVIFVGAQRSSDRGSSDAALNLLSAAYFISKRNYKGIGICMHKSSDDDLCFILKPHNTRKLHTSRRDAFRPINSLPLAEVDFKARRINLISSNKRVSGKLESFPINPKIKVGFLKVRPNISVEEFEAYKNFDGLIIEGTGFGHAPVGNVKILKVLKSLARQMPVIATSQCVYGRVNLHVYSAGRQMLKAGIIESKEGITSETAYIKLAWLLSNFKDVKRRFNEDFRGENNSRILLSSFLY